MSQQKAAAAQKKGGLKLILLAAVPLVALAAGGGAAYVMGLPPFGHHADAAAVDPASGHGAHGADGAGAVPGGPGGPGGGGGGARSAAVQFVDLPDLVVNLDTGAQRIRFLKLKVALEVGSSADADRVLQLSPRIIDSFQLYLRALRPEDLSGATGLYRLKEELLARANVALGRADVRDLLFKEMLVQ
jgi:flagellar FliL protein